MDALIQYRIGVLESEQIWYHHGTSPSSLSCRALISSPYLILSIYEVPITYSCLNLGRPTLILTKSHLCVSQRVRLICMIKLFFMKRCREHNRTVFMRYGYLQISFVCQIPKVLADQKNKTAWVVSGDRASAEHFSFLWGFIFIFLCFL